MIFSVIEYTLLILAFLVSIYVAFQEGFKKKNITLIFITLVVLVFNSLHFYSFFATGWGAEINFPITNIEMLVEVALYLLLYTFLVKKKEYRLFLTSYLIFFLVFSWIVATKIQPIHAEYPTYSFVFGSFGILIGILLFFYEKLNETNAENIFRNFWFWISAGLFVFFAAEIPIMSLLNYLLQQEYDVIEQVTPVLNAKRVISLIYYLMYLVGILCMKMRT